MATFPTTTLAWIMGKTVLRLAWLLLAVPLACAAGKLGSYNVDVHGTSVSGLSSGAAMTVQLDVAYSSIMKGAGVLAGPPYLCAQGSLFTALSDCTNAVNPIDVPALVQQTKDSAQRGEIDAVANLANQRIWLFSGGGDTVVQPSVVTAVEHYYKKLVTPANVALRTKADAEHAMPTLAYGNACPVLGDPYISDCNYDAAGKLLAWIYPGLKSKRSGPLHGTLLTFDQGDFVTSPAAHDMADTGFVFVPENCAAQKPCRLHVALHGCDQYPDYRYFANGAFLTFGDTFAQHAGYNAWADTNDIIVLYPQAARSAPLFAGVLEVDRNPHGCWDWWGYDDAAYATRNATQMKAIRAMIDRIAK
jgi:poly(3-hydroxybutyrate) depolymerase